MICHLCFEPSMCCALHRGCDDKIKALTAENIRLGLLVAKLQTRIARKRRQLKRTRMQMPLPASRETDLRQVRE
jgi:hypothetical protein